MSEFDGESFYGYSLLNDPALSTTTKNFEFRYTRPEQLEHAIKTVKSYEGSTKKQFTPLPENYCTVTVAGCEGAKRSEMRSPSRLTSPKKELRHRCVPLQCSEPDTKTYITNISSTDRSQISTPGRHKILKKMERPPRHHDSKHDQCDALKHPKSRPIPPTIEEEIPLITSSSGSLTYRTAIGPEYYNSKPHWVEINEQAPVENIAVQRVIRKKRNSSNQRTGAASRKPTDKVLSCDDGKIRSSRNRNTELAFNRELRSGFYAVDHVDSEPDLKNHRKCHDPTPQKDYSLKSNCNEEKTEKPLFIEVETPKVSSWTFLKRNTPLQYTDISESETEEEHQTTYAGPSNMKVVITKATENNNSISNPTGQLKNGTTAHRAKTIKVNTVAKKQVQKKTKAGSNDSFHTITAKAKQTLRREYVVPPPRQRKRPEVQEAPSQARKQYAYPQYNYTYSPRLGRRRTDMTKKTLDELKTEKMAIFQKMTTNQECIIETLERLRNDLRDVYVPDNQCDRSKRQKNAFEFSVRLSRNYLYPLKGMIEDLKDTPTDHLHSALSNDASTRVAAIFSLMLQSLQTYHKQLRYFLLDQVPQKLTTLLEMITTAMAICEDKNVFDKNDAIVESLLEKVSKLTDFLENLHQERMMTAQEKFNKANALQSLAPRYDLKMFLNDLNMYEPKLVPRVNPKKMRKSSKQQLHIKSVPSMETQCGSVRRLKSVYHNEDMIETQMQISNDKSSTDPSLSGSKNAVIEKKIETKTIGNSEMDCAILHALRRIARHQVREVLQPFIKTLGKAIDKEKTPELLELVVNAFESKMHLPQSTVANEMKPPSVPSITTANSGSPTDCNTETNNDDNGGTKPATYASRAFEATKQTKLTRQPTESGATKQETRTSSHDIKQRSSSVSHIEDSVGGKIDCDGLMMNKCGNDDDDVHCCNAATGYNYYDINCHDDVLDRLPVGTSDIPDLNKRASNTSGLSAHKFLDYEDFSIDAQLTCGFLSDVTKPSAYDDNDTDYSDDNSNEYAILCKKITPPKMYAQFIRDSSAAIALGNTVKSIASSIASNIASNIANNIAYTTTTPSNTACNTTNTATATKNIVPMDTVSNDIVPSDSDSINTILTNPVPKNIVPTNTVSPDTVPNNTVRISSIIPSKICRLSRTIVYGTKGVDTTTGTTPIIGSIAATRLKMMTRPMPAPISSIPTKIEGLRLAKKAHDPDTVPPPVPQSTPREEYRNPVIEKKPTKQSKVPKLRNQYVSKTTTESLAGSLPKTQQLDHIDWSTRLCSHLTSVQKPKIPNTIKVSFASKPETIQEIQQGETKKSSKRATNIKRRGVKDSENLLKERNVFLKTCSKSPFYVNANFENPWKVFAKLSERMVAQAVKAVKVDFAVGVDQFVEDFLKLETKI